MDTPFMDEAFVRFFEGFCKLLFFGPARFLKLASHSPQPRAVPGCGKYSQIRQLVAACKPLQKSNAPAGRRLDPLPPMA
jgi:hypothetical protein